MIARALVSFGLSVVTSVVIGGASASAQQSWHAVDQVHPGVASALLVDSDTLYAVVDTILYYRAGGTSVWHASAVIPTDGAPASLTKVGNRLFVGTYADGVFETSNLGASWSARSIGLSGSGALSVTALVSRGDSLYAGTAGSAVFVLNLNGGTQWTPFRTGIPSLVAWDVLTLYAWGGWLFCGSGQNSYIHINPPGETTWTGVPFNEVIVTDLGMLAMGGSGDDLIGAAFNGIYTSTDTGSSWNWFATPFSVASDGAIVFTPDRTFVAFGHSSRGMYLYERAGASWQLFDHQPVYCTDVVWFEDRLYAATFSGLQYLPLAPTDIADPQPQLPTSMTLSQNYPNPFNPSTTIQFSLAQSSRVRLDIYNILGQHVRELANDYRPAGDYLLAWDGMDYSQNPVGTGVYYYRLTTDHGVLSRAMVLIR